MPAPRTATAEIKPTQGNDVKGNVTFKLVDGALRVTGQLSGLKPDSEHGFHIHEKGDCSAPDGSSAGGHFNPGAAAHGRAGAGAHHLGDLDNLSANAEGVAQIDTILQGASLGGGAVGDILGKAIVVHADPDDYRSQPSGNAGARLACGVIRPAR
ncbi:superoxide dismutase family protein [Xanthomonas sp. Kuri4-1]